MHAAFLCWLSWVHHGYFALTRTRKLKVSSHPSIPNHYFLPFPKPKTTTQWIRVLRLTHGRLRSINTACFLSYFWGSRLFTKAGHMVTKSRINENIPKNYVCIYVCMYLALVLGAGSFQQKKTEAIIWLYWSNDWVILTQKIREISFFKECATRESNKIRSERMTQFLLLCIWEKHNIPFFFFSFSNEKREYGFKSTNSKHIFHLKVNEVERKGESER